jgi:hypothetical protein
MTASAAFLSTLLFMQGPVPQSDLSLALACGERPGELILTIRNSGSSDTAILLGMAFANGRWYEPRELIVELTRSGNTAPEDLVYNGARSVAGRIDHWVVALPIGAAFALTLRPSDFIALTQPAPAAPPEELRIRLTGRPVTSDLNVDMSGLKVWRLWTGSTRSNSVQVSHCSQSR